MDPNERLCVNQGELLSSPDSYRRLVGKLNYLTITRLDIAFAVNVVSHLMLNPRSTYMEAALKMVRYRKAHSGDGLFYGVHGHLLVEGSLMLIGWRIHHIGRVLYFFR